MHDDADWQLLARYLSGLASPEEEQALERWLAAGPTRRDALARLREVWDRSAALPFAESAVDTRAAWTVLADKMAKSPVHPRQPPLRVVPWSSRRVAPLLRIAAVLVLATSSVLVWERLSHHGRADETAPRPMQMIATVKGERANIRLSDGSRIVVGVDTRVQYAENFGACPASGACARDVFLDGQAYFDVVHDPARPFRVHTAHAVTEDIGTAFVVRAYRGDARAEVAVAEGEVALRSPAVPEPVHLTKGDVGRVTAEGRLTAEHGVNLDRYLSWTTGRLVFDHAPLSDVLAQLGHWYDVHFELGDSTLASCRFSATLRIESLPDLLDAVALALDVRYERRGDVVVLFPASHPRS